MQNVLNRETLASRVVAVLVSLALAVGLTPVAGATHAWAADAPFTASVGGAQVDAANIALEAGAYEYTPYGGEAGKYDLYTVTVPEGTSEAVLDFGDTKHLVYAYDANGNYVDVCGSFEATVGESQAPVALGSDPVYAYVQNPYNADWTGGDLLYVVTFKYENSEPEVEAPFTVTVDGAAIADSAIERTVEGCEGVDLYTVSVPEGSTSATLDFGGAARIVYAYDKSGNYLEACGEFDFTVGETSAPVTILDSTGAAVYAHVQNPYNADWTGGELLYAVTFKFVDAPEPDPEPASTAGAYTDEAASTLIENLTKRFADGGANEAISNMTVSAAFALHAEGLGSSINADAVAAALANAESDDPYFSVGTLAKYVLALNAAGVDCSAVEVAGTTRDLVSELVEGIDASSANVWSAVYLLPALDAVAPEETELAGALVDVIVASQNEEGLFGGDWADSQTTAQAIMALQGHGQDAAISAAKDALLKMQNSDGGFAYTQGGASNLEATAACVVALSALGTDCAQVLSTGGATPLDYLVASADTTLDGYEDATSSDEAMSSAEALLALVANQGFKANGGAFNAYTDVVASDVSGAGGSSGSKTLAKTGDSEAPAALLICAFAALGVAAAARRRVNG